MAEGPQVNGVYQQINQQYFAQYGIVCRPNAPAPANWQQIVAANPGIIRPGVDAPSAWASLTAGSYPPFWEGNPPSVSPWSTSPGYSNPTLVEGTGGPYVHGAASGPPQGGNLLASLLNTSPFGPATTGTAQVHPGVTTFVTPTPNLSTQYLQQGVGFGHGGPPASNVGGPQTGSVAFGQTPPAAAGVPTVQSLTSGLTSLGQPNPATFAEAQPAPPGSPALSLRPVNYPPATVNWPTLPNSCPNAPSSFTSTGYGPQGFFNTGSGTQTPTPAPVNQPGAAHQAGSRPGPRPRPGFGGPLQILAAVAEAAVGLANPRPDPAVQAGLSAIHAADQAAAQAGLSGPSVQTITGVLQDSGLTQAQIGQVINQYFYPSTTTGTSQGLPDPAAWRPGGVGGIGPVPGNPCDWGISCMPDPPPQPPQQPTVTSLVPVDAAGCGLPTPAVARVYTTTVSGVTNVTCSACNGFNQAWTLSFASRNRGSGVSDCGWDSNDPPGLCTPVGPYGNAELRYQNAGSYELLFKGSGGSNQATYTCAGGSFNGLGPSTFTRTTPAAAAGCDNWPGSLTVSPA